MKEIGLTKQKMLLIGVVVIFVLALIMLGVMFLGKKGQLGKKGNIDGQEIVDNEENIAVDNQKTVNKEVGSGDKISKLEAGRIFGLTIKPGTNLAMFYQEENFLTVNPFSGKKNSLGSYPFGEVKDMWWNNDSNKALVKYQYVDDYFVYNLNDNSVRKLNGKIDLAIWNKAGDKVIYKYYNSTSKKRRLKIMDLDGSNNQLIVDNLPYRKIDLILQPGLDRVCYLPSPDARVKGKLFCLNMKGQDKRDYGGQFGQDYLWSPSGQKILTSFTREKSGNQLVLAVMNKDGGETKGLAFATTVRKCVWSKNDVDVYCAMVGGAPLDVMLPNAWDEQIFNSADTFWKINTQTGKKERLIDLEKIPGAIDAENLVLDTEEKFLFFRARRDGSLWRIRL